MESSYQLNSFVFESRETYDLAKREYDIINMLKEKVDLSDEKSALKVYNKFATEKTFVTIVGESFLIELRQYLIESGYGTDESLSPIPVRERKVTVHDTMPARPQGESKFKRKYEQEKDKNSRMKIVLIAAIVMLIGFTVITAGSDYSVFTYFTNYKEKMENEIIDKYEKWEDELTQRENALKKQENGANQ